MPPSEKSKKPKTPRKQTKIAQLRGEARATLARAKKSVATAKRELHALGVKAKADSTSRKRITIK